MCENIVCDKASTTEEYYSPLVCEALLEVFGTADFIELLRLGIHIPPEQAVPAIIRTVWANRFEDKTCASVEIDHIRTERTDAVTKKELVKTT